MRTAVVRDDCGMGNGRARNLITLMNDGAGQGYAAWRTLPAPDAWQDIVQDGLFGGRIVF